MKKKMTLEEMVAHYITNGARDAHNSEFVYHEEFDIIVELNNGKFCLATTNNRYVLLNELYVSDKSGNMVWSTTSIAGTLKKDDVEEYNKGVVSHALKIKSAVKIVDGRPQMIYGNIDNFIINEVATVIQMINDGNAEELEKSQLVIAVKYLLEKINYHTSMFESGSSMSQNACNK
jgi:hypothetical protein